MRRGYRDQPLDSVAAVACQIGSADQPAHAVCDQNDPVGASGLAHFFDSLTKLGHQLADAGLRRGKADRRDRVAGRLEPAPQQPPDAATAVVAVHEKQ